MDKTRLSQLSEALWMFWAFTLVGFDNAILGPCLPDLEARVGASLESMSFVFFVQGTGFLTGLLIGLLLDNKRFSRRLLIGVYVICGSTVNAGLPLVPSYGYLLSMFFLQGLTKGLVDFGVLSLCNVLHEKEKAIVFQFVVTGAGLATFITPFIAKPFINDHVTWTASSTLASTSGNATDCIATQWRPAPLAKTLWTGGTQGQGPLQHGPSAGDVLRSEDDVRLPFVIVGAITLPAGVAFLYFHFTKGGTYETHGNLNDGDLPRVDSRRVTSRDRRARAICFLFRVLVVILHVPVFGLLITFAGLLTALGALWPLCMTPQEMTYVTVVLWGAFGVGRALNVAMATCLAPFLLLSLNSLGLVTASGVVAGFALHSPLALWFGTAAFGFFLSPFLPGYIAWSSLYFPLSAAFITACLFTSGVGEMLLPFIGDLLLSHLNGEALLGFLLSVTVGMFCLFLLAAFLALRMGVH